MISGQLIIKPVSANLTYDTEFFGKMDPYAKITLGANCFKTSVALDQGKNPNWQDSFTARVKGEQSMMIELWDKDDIGNDEFIAEAQVNIAEVYQRRNVSNWYPVHRKGKSAGSVMILLEFYPDGAGMAGGMGAPMGMQAGYGAPMGMQAGYGAPMGMQAGYGAQMAPAYGGYGMPVPGQAPPMAGGFGMGYGAPQMGGMGYGAPPMGGMGYGAPPMGGPGYGAPPGFGGQMGGYGAPRGYGNGW
jgi:C2 domain